MMERFFVIIRFQHCAHASQVNSSIRPGTPHGVENRPQRALPLWKRQEVQEMLRPSAAVRLRPKLRDSLLVMAT
jgi:hypothetical protein